jgi:DNA repair protein RadA/Sms
MSKVSVKYCCQVCGYESLKWLGRCPDCGKWNTLVEEVVDNQHITSCVAIPSLSSSQDSPVALPEISATKVDRLTTGMREFDRVLGGGIVPGMLILIGGDPGVGKSTLLLQISHLVSQKYGNVLYVTGEESAEQIKLRAERLHIDADNIYVIAECNLNNIISHIENVKPCISVIDSIQTIYKPEVMSTPGSISQIRECTTSLMYLSKTRCIPIFIIGHVTKEGAIAGPKVLEHIVDTVLYFEGDEYYTYRILRAVKNRFGSNNEIGVFKVQENGLTEVLSPSTVFLSHRPENVSGTVVTATMEGTRAILVEIQALVCPTNFGMPRREAIGIDYNRMSLLLAVLERKIGLHLGGYDVFVNIVGGIKAVEPAIDLAIVCCIVSSMLDKIISPEYVMVGEIGLSGEVRPVSFIEKRIEEIAKLGFKYCILPAYNNEKMPINSELKLIQVSTLREALYILKLNDTA